MRPRPSRKTIVACKITLVAKSPVFAPRRLAVFWHFIVCLVLSIAFPLSGFGQEAFRRHITVYGNSALLEKYPADVARNYNLVITGWEKSSSLARIKEMNSGMKAIFYRDLNGVHTYYDDWPDLRTHPDWFVRDMATKEYLVRKEFGWYLMDITNAQYRRYLKGYILRKVISYPVFDGVFLDDVAANIHLADFVTESGQMIPGTTNSAYTQDYRKGVMAFLRELKEALPTKLVVVNSDDRTLYVQYADGIMLEGFVHGSWQPAGYHKDGLSWLADMQDLAKLLKLNKLVLVHSGSQGSGELLEKQFLFCFASFLLVCDQDAYFFFDTSTYKAQLLPFRQYARSFGAALESLSPSAFATTVIERPMSSSMNGWTATRGVSIVKMNGNPALQFASDGPNGAYASRCIDLSGSNVGTLNMSCLAKGSDVRAGSVSWMRFALLGKFYDADHKVLQAGVDLPLDTGTYDWRTYNVSYPLPPMTEYYCVSSLGFYPSSRGKGWVKGLRINSTIPVNQWFKRAFQKVTVFVNPTNVAKTTGIPKQPGLQPETGHIVPP